jgi:ribosomal protein S18 acetylase RimI-like enzyme
VTAPFRVRPFRPADRDACLRVFDSNVPAAFRPEERSAFARFLDDPPGPMIVVERDGDGVVACGGVAVEPDSPRTASMCWGMVREDLHGRGLGRLLLEARIRALEAGDVVDTLRLETIPDTVGFFRRMGFEVVREEPGGYGPGLPRVELRRPIRREELP